MKVILKVIEGPDTGRSFEFDRPNTFLVGRSRQTHYTLSKDDNYVSRKHFMIEVAPPNCYLKDFGSKNGTYVNEKKVENTILRNGDCIRIGRTTLKVDVMDQAEQLIPACDLCGKPAPDYKHLPSSHTALVICPECKKQDEKKQEERLQRSVIKIPANCRDCGMDVSQRCNTDGQGEDLQGIALYLCEGCVKKRKKPTDIDVVDDYQIISELGKGGMGIVYAAWHRPTGRLVALKRILLNNSSEKMKKRFSREMRIMENLKHNNIVRLLDTGIYQNDNYLVSEFLEGGDAHQLITHKYKGSVPPKVACQVIVDILKGLENFHSGGNIHRDIKPMNMLLQKGADGTIGNAKLADFGLAKSYSDAGGTAITGMGEVSGSILYMAPEQIIHFKDTPPSADVYSVAVSLYELLTARYPFHFPTQLDALKAKLEKREIKDPVLIVLEDEPIPVKERNPNVPSQLGMIIDKAIQKEARNRFATAAEFRGELEKQILKM